MFETVTPFSLFRTHLQQLQATLPGVLDGEPGGIHDARITTRRLRELLPLLRTPMLDETDAASRFRRLGRSLGRVRDTDARIDLLVSLERRMPVAAPALVVARQERERERLLLIRKLIKRLERLDAVRFVSALVSHQSGWRTTLRAGAEPKWRSDLRHLIADRAHQTAAAIEHATGVYFPNRTHHARIAIKRLRYALEIAHDSGIIEHAAALATLKKVQDILGDLHDRQDLVDDFCAASAPESAVDDDLTLVRQVLEAEARHLHGRYLERRTELLEICATALPRSTSVRGAFVSRAAVAAAAISPCIYVARRLHARPLHKP